MSSEVIADQAIDSGWWLALGAVVVPICVLGVVAIFGLGGPRLESLAPTWAASFMERRSYWLAATGLTVALTTGVYALLRPLLGGENLALGALLWWVALGLHGDFQTPATSYLTLWPALFSLIATGVPLVIPRMRTGSWGWFAVICVTALPAVALIVPLMCLSATALGPALVVLPMVLLSLLTGLLSQPMEICHQAWRWSVPLLAVATALISVAASFV